MMAFLASLLKPVAALLAAWLGGKKAGKDAATVQELKAYAETFKKIDAVGPVPDAAEWLLKRSKQQRDL